MITYGSHAKQLIANGYTVVPIYPNAKRPATGKGWNSPENLNPDPAKFANCGIGIVCGVGETPVYAIDIDIKDNSISESINNTVSESFGDSPLRIGNFPKRLRVFRGPEGLRKTVSDEFDVIGKIERLGKGQQFVAFGFNVDANTPYNWPEKSLLEIKATDLPELPADFTSKIFEDYSETATIFGFSKKSNKPAELSDMDESCLLLLNQKEPLGLTIDRMQRMLRVLDPDCSRDMWRNIGFALHHETDGSNEGFDLWDSWSSGGAKYNESEMQDQWDSFGKFTGEPITAAYLLRQVKDQTDNLLLDNSNPLVGFKSMDWDIDRFVDNPEEVPVIIENLLLQGFVGMIFSSGGVGKSTLILDMAIRICLANIFKQSTFMGYNINGGSVVILTAEDPDLIINRRFNAITECISGELSIDSHELRSAVKPYLKVWATFGKPVSLFEMSKDKLKTTQYYDDLVDRIKTLPDLKLVVIDTRTRYSPAEDEGNVIATSEISLYERIVSETGASVMLVHHSRKSARDGMETGEQAFRGPSGTYDGMRYGFYLRRISDKEREIYDLGKDDKAYIFENPKNSYIPEHKDVLITRNGFSFEYRIVGTKLTKGSKKLLTQQEAFDSAIIYMQQEPDKEYSRTLVMEYLKETFNLHRNTANSIINIALKDGYVEDIINGKETFYILTEYGRKYGLTLKGV